MNSIRLFYALFVLSLWLLPQQCLCESSPVPAWERTYGSGTLETMGQEYWSGYYVAQTSDGGFLASGSILQNIKYAPYGRGVLKISTNGTEQWRSVVGDSVKPVLGKLVYENIATSTFEFLGCLSSGLGVRSGLIYFMEISAQGDSIKSRYTYSENGSTYGIPIAQLTRDGNAILAAPVGLGPGQNKEFLLAKADKQGKKLWERRFVGEHEGFTAVDAVLQTSDGGYAFCGYSYPLSGTTATMVVIRTDGEGKQEWQYTYSEHFDLSADLHETDDGGFLLLANQYRTNPYQRVIHLIKLDKDGKQEWERYIEKGEILNGNSLLIHSSGSLFIAGYSAVYENRQVGKVSVKSYDSYLAKVGWDGTVAWEVNNVSGAFDMLQHVIATRDGGIAATGQRNDSLYLAAFSPDVVSTAPEEVRESSAVRLVGIAPNPVVGRARVQYVLQRSEQIAIELLDALGKPVGMVYSGLQESGEHAIDVDIRGYASGVYFVRLHTAVGTAIQKLVVQP